MGRVTPPSPHKLKHTSAIDQILWLHHHCSSNYCARHRLKAELHTLLNGDHHIFSWCIRCVASNGDRFAHAAGLGHGCLSYLIPSEASAIIGNGFATRRLTAGLIVNQNRQFGLGPWFINPSFACVLFPRESVRASRMDHSSRQRIAVSGSKHSSSSATPEFVTPSTSPPNPSFMAMASAQQKAPVAHPTTAPPVTASHQPELHATPTQSDVPSGNGHDSAGSKASPKAPNVGHADTKLEHTAPDGEAHEAGKDALSPISEEPKGHSAGNTGQAALLRARPFIIRTIKLDPEGSEQVTGSILSQSLDKILTTTNRTDAGTLSLAGLRKLVPQMSRYPSIEKFCLPSGTLIDDETISFTEYLGLEEAPEAAATSSGAPSLKLYFCSTKLGATAGKGAHGTDASSIAEFKPVNLGEKPAVQIDKEATIEGGLLTRSEIKELITDEAFGASEGKSAGLLHENEWAVVLRNCAVFYGWIIDPYSKRIVRAPKPAFRLRSKIDQDPIARIPDFVPQEVKSEASGDVSTTEQMVTREAKEAKNLQEAKSVKDVKEAKEVKEGKEEKEEKGDKEKKSDSGSKEVTQKEDSEESVEAVAPTSDKGIPNFRVNDDSKIEITAHEHELTVSMARSDFSESSTEASISGGGFGVSAGVSGGYAKSQSKTAKSMESSTTKTLVARYMFPRCDLLLWPDEMEPTEELAGLIDNIRKTKNLKALRKLHTEYGHLFCQRVTLGGRLLSTKVLSATESQTMEESKESFKKSVGASVSGSYGGFSASASVKHESAQGNATAAEQGARTQNEAAVFEAVGGDTIMANNPSGWSATVGKYENWRVINREGLSPLVEILAGMPGYEAVQSWFVQAVPALSRYMLLDESHECKARFCVMSPTNSLSIPNPGGNVAFYLGHDADKPVTPRLNGCNPVSTSIFWSRIDIEQEIPIFNPQTYRAPTILGYDNFMVENTPYGAAWNAAYAKTVWTIIAPFDEELMHGTRVILRTMPYRDPNIKLGAGQTDSTPNASHMVVFRNAQGEFLPAMSDSDEYQYWRLVKTNPSQRHIKPGDEVRLAWDFKDQTTGWRDFTQDVFGRRQVCAPVEANVQGPLFLKVPWPRFETSRTPTAMIMSPDQGDLVPKIVTISKQETNDTSGKRDAFTYCLQDVRLRIDNVGNGGRGDVDDYLLNNVKMEGTITHVNVRTNGQPMQMRSSIFWFGIY